MVGQQLGDQSRDAANWVAQAKIDAGDRPTADVLENDGSGVSDLVRRAEFDVDVIRFIRPRDEQWPAIALRLDGLLHALAGEEEV